MYLELNESDSEAIGKIMILKKPLQEETKLGTEHLLQDVPMQFWAPSSTGIGKIKSATPIKVATDNTMLLTNTYQYPLRPDALAGIKFIIQDYLKIGLIIPCIRLCNSPILSVKKKMAKYSKNVHEDLTPTN